MEEKCRAVVLKTTDYKDNDKMLTLFSYEYGVISACARGVKKASSKLKFAVQPFCFCEYVFKTSSGRRTVVSADLIESFYGIRESSEKYYAGCLALEFSMLFAPEGDDGRALFLLLGEFLETLCYSAVKVKTALAAFLLNGLRIAGYELAVSGCIRCRKPVKNRAFFNFGAGAAVCEECAGEGDIEINPSTVALLSSLEGRKLTELTDVDFSEMIENKALRLLIHFTRLKTGVELRSASGLSLGR